MTCRFSPDSEKKIRKASHVLMQIDAGGTRRNYKATEHQFHDEVHHLMPIK